MQTEDNASQGADPADLIETSMPSSDVPATPAAAAPPAPVPEGQEGKAADPAKPEEPEKPKQTPWFQKRIDDLTREKWDERREKDALRARLEELERAGKQPPAAPPSDGQQPQGHTPQPDPSQFRTQADFDRAVSERAAEVARTNEFNANCNKVFEEGTKAYPDFQSALGNFRMLGGLPPALIEAAIETENAHGVLYQLGKDPNEAQRIMALSPTRMAVAVAKLASKPPEAVAVSQAPAPIVPIQGKGAPLAADPDKMTDEQWMKWRDAQDAKKRAAH